MQSMRRHAGRSRVGATAHRATPSARRSAQPSFAGPPPRRTRRPTAVVCRHGGRTAPVGARRARARPSTVATSRTAALCRSAACHSSGCGHGSHGGSSAAPSPASVAAIAIARSTMPAIVSSSMQAWPRCGAHTARANASPMAPVSGPGPSTSATIAAACTSAGPNTPASTHGSSAMTADGVVTAVRHRRPLRNRASSVSTVAAGGRQENTPYGSPSRAGVSAPTMPRTNRYATPPRW